MFAIDAVRVFDGERLLPDGALLIVEDGTIAGIEPRGTAVPERCAVHRLTGATVLPGLIDTHAHLCCDGAPDAISRLPDVADLGAVVERSLAAHLAAGVTTVRDLGDRLWAVVDWRDANSAARWPTVLASGPPITAPNGHCATMGGEVEGEAGLRRAVAERAERGVDVVKIMASGGLMTPGTDVTRPQFTDQELRAVVAEAHARGLPVTAHAHPLRAIRGAVTAGVDGIEHCSFLTASGIDIAPDLVAALVDAGIAVCPTLGAVPGSEPPPAVQEMLRAAGLTLEQGAVVWSRLHLGGVRVVSGTDGGIHPDKPHGILPESVIALVDGGTPAAAALATATSAAADACGLGDGKGRLRVGLDADLVVLDGDPLSDVRALRAVREVYLRGHLVSPEGRAS
jgi:imidazolonepropionase-like amidohydrolase